MCSRRLRKAGWRTGLLAAISSIVAQLLRPNPGQKGDYEILPCNALASTRMGYGLGYAIQCVNA
jgi:hypothetical protein